MPEAVPPGSYFESAVPARLDRLPWSAWHRRVVVALGITWALDGLEVTLVGAVGSVLSEPDTLGLDEGRIGLSASAYLAGAIFGALLFGRLTDALGRKRLFFVTLALYTIATIMTGFAWNFWSFAFFRALTGAGIGGEYAAVNATIDEIIPARVRGRTDLAINGTYWLGAALGSSLTIVLLNPRLMPHSIGWRAAFLLGGVIGTSVLFMRRYLPESPRWLLLHGRVAEADRVVSTIEAHVERTEGALPQPKYTSHLQAKGRVTFASIARVLVKSHRKRTILGLSLMIAQAFAYNGVFFTYALVLRRFYGVPSSHVGLYLIPFAIGNLLGPLTLGHLFDSVGRRPMIAGTYALSGVLIALTGFGMAAGVLTAMTQTLLWCAVFFVASAAASSAYLTVSELFPVELRGMAIALFFAVGTAVGGLVAPALFGALVHTGSVHEVLIGYLIGASLMILAGIVAAVLGVRAEGRPIEEVSA